MTDFAAHTHRADGRVTAAPTTPRERVGVPQPAALAAASVLAHPSRRRIAEELGGAPGGLTVAEVVTQIGDLHHNAIRNHLRILAQAGLVAVERNPPRGRGRPTERFVLVDPEVSRIAAQQALVQLLVTMLVDAGVDHDRARAFGEAHASLVVSGAQREQLIGSLARFGFAPHETTSVKDAASGALEAASRSLPVRRRRARPRRDDRLCAASRAAGRRGHDRPVPRHDHRIRGAHPHDAGCIVRFEGIAAVPKGAPTLRPAQAVTSPAH